MAVISGITFAGYIDEPDELLQGERRVLCICDDDTASASLPGLGYNMELKNGGTTANFAAGSIALVRGGSTLVLGTDDTWVAL